MNNAALHLITTGSEIIFRGTAGVLRGHVSGIAKGAYWVSVNGAPNTPVAPAAVIRIAGPLAV